MNIRNNKPLVGFAAIIAALAFTFSSLFLGCTASGSGTQDSAPQEEPAQPSTPTAATPAAQADKTDPASETKLVAVKAGEPLMDVIATRGFPLGGVLTRNGLTMADLGTVLSAEANAGMIATRCSVSVGKARMAASLGDALDGGVDAGALRGSAAFYGLSCLRDSLEFRVTRDGDLTVPVHGRAELGKQLVGTKSGIADLGRRLVAMHTEQATTVASLAQVNANLDRLATEVKTQKKADEAHWNKVFASILLALAAALVLGLAHLAYRKKHPLAAKQGGTTIDDETITGIVKKTLDTTNQRNPPADLQAMITAAVDAATAKVLLAIKPAEIAANAVLQLQPTISVNTAALTAVAQQQQLITAALSAAAAATDRCVKLNDQLDKDVDDLAKKANKLAIREAEVAKKEEERSTATPAAEEAPATRHEGQQRRRNEATAPAILSVTRTERPTSGAGAMSAVVPTTQGIGNGLQALIDAEKGGDDGAPDAKADSSSAPADEHPAKNDSHNDTHEPSPKTMLGTGIVGRELHSAPASTETPDDSDGEANLPDLHDRGTRVYPAVATRMNVQAAATDAPDTEDDDHKTQVSLRAATVDDNNDHKDDQTQGDGVGRDSPTIIAPEGHVDDTLAPAATNGLGQLFSSQPSPPAEEPDDAAVDSNQRPTIGLDIEDPETVDNGGEAIDSSRVRGIGDGTNGHAKDAAVDQKSPRRETFKPEVTANSQGAGFGFVCTSCRENLPDGDACATHTGKNHYRCMMCDDKPVLNTLAAWMNHLETQHQGDHPVDATEVSAA